MTDKIFTAKGKGSNFSLFQKLSSRKTPAWYVSFGDLLTLLLCFILSLICYGHIKVIPASEVTPQNNKDSLSSEKNETLGTSFATNSLEVGSGVKVLPTLSFAITDFDDGKLSETKEAELAEMVEAHGSEQFLVRSCSVSDGYYKALEQALTLRQTLLRQGVAAKKQRVELLGCKELKDGVLMVEVL